MLKTAEEAGLVRGEGSRTDPERGPGKGDAAVMHVQSPGEESLG